MISARDIVKGLGGSWRGKSGTCRCPAHEDKSPSFSVSETRDGRPLVHCFAGCPQGNVIAALKARGLWEGDGVKDPGYPQGFTRKHDSHTNGSDRRNHEFARELWDRSDRIGGTVAEAYLVFRGIKPLWGWPDTLGYLPRLKHGPSGKVFPALIAAVTDGAGQVLAVQRTWLAADGQGKAPVDSAKMTIGPMRDGAVRLGRPLTALGLAEGVETALSARQIYQIPTWATLSANRLDKVKIPEGVQSITIFADHGRVGMECAMNAADVYEAKGLTVEVMPPAVHFGDEAKDFNDALRARA